MEIVEQIGAYAGFASVVGLAILSALYFSQARDVRRLREWAGRAPERAAEQEARIQANAQATAQQAAGARPAPAAPGAAPAVPGKTPAVPGAKPAPAGSAPPAAPAAPAQTGAAQAGTATAAPPTSPPTTPGAKPATGGPPPPPPPPRPTPLPPLPSRAGAGGQTSILPPSMRPKEPWYRRIHWPAPRYLALIVAGILIVGGGAAYGVTQLLEEDEPGTQQPASAGDDPAAGGDEQQDARPARVDPSRVTVAVLNGTTVTGLATQVADKLEQEGFQRGNVTNFTEQARNESVVLYAAGHQREARAVAKALDINQIERVDAETQVLAGNATVTVVVGADQTQ